MTDYATKSDIAALRREMATKSDLEQLRSEMATKSDLRQLGDEMKTHIGTLYEKFSGDVALLSEQMTGVDKRLGRVEKKVEVLTDTVGDIKVELTAINDKLDRKSDKSVVRILDRRVAALEAK